jgi:hypothetical protein
MQRCTCNIDLFSHLTDSNYIRFVHELRTVVIHINNLNIHRHQRTEYIGKMVKTNNLILKMLDTERALNGTIFLFFI